MYTKTRIPLFEINLLIKRHADKCKTNIEHSNCNKRNNKNPADVKYVGLTYVSKFSDRIGKIFSKHNYRPGFKTKNNLSKKLYTSNHVSDNNEFNNSGVYAIDCNDCDSRYIGKTGRSFHKRFKEHLKDPNSNIYQHMKNSNHTISDIETNLIILHKNKDEKTLNVLESMEIRCAMLNNIPLLNAQLDLQKSISRLTDLCIQLLSN